MEKSNLSLDIFDTLKNRIIRWAYLPGQRLTEESLCQEFGVSRVPVREALRMLEDSKLVDKVPYRGCTVKQPDLTEIHELYDVRLALELFVVEQLTTKGMDPELWQAMFQTWDTLLNQNDDTGFDPFFLARRDEEFHEQLALASANRTLQDLLRSVNERLYFVRMTDITTPERMHVTCNHHLQILTCLQSGDHIAAREAMQINIEFGRSNVESALKDALIRAYLTNPK
jgi:DNA-binding GntR family transcriptional regulator